MKKNLSALLIIAFVSAAPALAQKIGYINSQQILANYKEAQDAQEQLDKINKQWEASSRNWGSSSNRSRFS